MLDILMVLEMPRHFGLLSVRDSALARGRKAIALEVLSEPHDLCGMT